MAQQFPVQVFANVNPPAPVHIYNYADAMTINSPLRVRLLLRDLSITNRRIRLKVFIEGNGLKVQSRDLAIIGAPLFIDGGSPLVLNNTELAPYFELQNLQGIGNRQYGQTLREGSYQFCFEVYDFFTNRRLSQKSCATTFIFNNDPPLLNIPFNKSNIEPQAVDNIVFQWTPRQINVSNVEYEFSLVEIWDDHVDPNTAFLTSPPIFTTTTRATSFIYGPAHPLLLHNKRYAWRVQAKALKGSEEIGLFRNEGKSEVFWFSKTEKCPTLDGVHAEPKGISKINVYWEEDPATYSEYTIMYRQKDRPNSRWFHKRTNSAWATVWDLKPNTTYEYKVAGKCKYQYGEYTAVQYITTGSADDPNANYNCGIVPEAIAITNREGHPNLMIGTRIMAGDFMMTITDITSQSNGVISGSGFVRVPYLEGARFGVTFDNILINTDEELAEGEIVTIYDPSFGEGATMETEVNVTEWLNTIGGLINDVREDIANALSNGAISQEEADEMSAILDVQEEAVQDVQTNVASSEDSEDEEEKEAVAAENKSTIEAVKEAIGNVSDRLGGTAAEGEVTEDATNFFDGYLPINSPSNGMTVQKIENKGTLFIPFDKKNGTIKFYEDYQAVIDGTPYNFIFTSSVSTKEEIALARKRANNPPNQGVVIYYHYDTDQSRLGYKVEMSQNYFGNGLNDEEFEWSRASFKRGIRNMIARVNSVEDWSTEIVDITHDLNKNFIKPILAVAKVPENLWNPDTSGYDAAPVHIVPIGAGITDGAIEEATGTTQLISLVIDYCTDDQVKTQIDKAWEELDFDKVVGYAEKFVKDRSELYETGVPHKIEYQSGKDVTAIATAVTGIGATVKTLKESTEFVKDLVTLVKKNVDEGVVLLAKYANIRKHLGNSRVTQYFEIKKLQELSTGIKKGNYKSYEDLLKKANPDVLDLMNKMDEFEFAEMIRGLRDLMNNNKLATFEEAIKDVTKFDGQYGWLKYWSKTPGLKYAMTTILDLRKVGNLLPTGNATDIQLATIQAFTRSGDFINQAKRYSPEFMGEFAETGWKHAKEGFDELRKVSGRLIKDKQVFSGKAFSKSQFEADFMDGIGKTIEHKSFISTSKLQSVAEAFTKLTKKWAGDGEKIAVVQRITTKNGVYIDDLSDWGKNLGPTRHSNAEKAIQIQEEVVLNPGLLKQVAKPIPIIENGVHKTIDGMKAYYIDFIEVVK